MFSRYDMCAFHDASDSLSRNPEDGTRTTEEEHLQGWSGWKDAPRLGRRCHDGGPEQ